MKIKQRYTYSNKRQLWRLLPADSGKLIIEERDVDSKEVYFNCIDIYSGKDIFKNYQLEEKSWIGIEYIYKDIIFFHHYVKPDMPEHTGIIAFDINSKKIIWASNEYVFLFVLNEILYCYKPKFEGRHFYSLNYKTGEIIEDLGDNAGLINDERNTAMNNELFSDYLFPEPFNNTKNISSEITKIFQNLKNEFVIFGNIEFITKNGLLLFNYHKITDNGNFKNIFNAIDILTGLRIFELVMNNQTKVLMPDSFFVKDNLLFLLKEKNRLVVCSIE